MLYTNCILSPRMAKDGLRISVMSRHTLNDGVTPDLRIKENLWDIHYPQFGPPSGLLGKYLRREIEWESYKKGYLLYLDNPLVFLKLKALGEHALNNNITLLCIEDEPSKCHRKLLAEKCKEIVPPLEIFIK